ncbi:MAG TPA: hypothetical protein VGX93_03450 [Chthoniobacterales bacterium]|nr:hypothetical protein [Chthoniobacterales bacterium]
MNLLLVLMDVRENLLRRDVVLWWGTCVLVTHVGGISQYTLSVCAYPGVN